MLRMAQLAAMLMSYKQRGAPAAHSGSQCVTTRWTKCGRDKIRATITRQRIAPGTSRDKSDRAAQCD
jgi:hypothetical protein